MSRTTDKLDHELTLEEAIELVMQGKAKLQVLKHFEFGRFSYLADRLLSRVTECNDDDAEGDLIAVILLQAAATECFLNDVLIHYTREAFGKGSKFIAEGMLGGSTRSKIYRVVPLLSRSTKVLDTESESVQNILNLIKTRNRIAHTTEYYCDDFEDFEKRSQEAPLTSTLSLEQCKKYQAALNTFISAIWNGPIEESPWQHALIKDAVPDEEE